MKTHTTLLLLFTIFLMSRADVSHLNSKYLPSNKAQDAIEETEKSVEEYEENTEPKVVNSGIQAQSASLLQAQQPSGSFIPGGGFNGIPGFPQQQPGFPGGFFPGFNGPPNGFPQQQAAQQGFLGAFLPGGSNFPGLNGLPNGIPGYPQQQGFPGFQQGFGQGFGQPNTGFPIPNFGNPLQQQFGNQGFSEGFQAQPFAGSNFQQPNQLSQFNPQLVGGFQQQNGFQQPGIYGLANNLRTLADSTVYDSNGGYVYEKPSKSFD